MNTTSSPLYEIRQEGDVHIVEFLQENLDPGAVEEIKLEMPRMIAGFAGAADGGKPEGAVVRKLVLDLTRVRYVPSRLLGVLIEANQLLTAQKGQLRICGLQPMILDVFKFMRLDSVLQVIGTRDEAIKSFGMVAGKA